MGQVTIRNALTSRGITALSPYMGSASIYEICNISLGSNPISLLEIVSALNSFNLTYGTYFYYYGNRTEKYNPKVYLSAVQTAAIQWNHDEQDPKKVDPKWVSTGEEKSGSC